MLDMNRDINSLSNFKRNTPDFLRQLKETGHPVVLTINGKAELVVQDTASYQKLIELAERAERMDALRASLEDMRPGRLARPRTCWPKCGKSSSRSKSGELPRRCHRQGEGRRSSGFPVDRRPITRCRRPLVPRLREGHHQTEHDAREAPRRRG